MLKAKMRIAGTCLGSFCLAAAMSASAFAATYTITYDAQDKGKFIPEQTQTITQTKETGETIQITDRTPVGSAKGPMNIIPLELNGGTIVGTPTSASYAYVVTIDFDKWTDDAAGNGTVYNAGQDYMADANLTLYAQWKSTMREETSKLPTVVREGYELLGWYDAAEGGNLIGQPGDEVILRDVGRLYARWNDNATPSGEDSNANGNDPAEPPTADPSNPTGGQGSSSTDPASTGDNGENNGNGENGGANEDSGDATQAQSSPLEIVVNEDGSVTITDPDAEEGSDDAEITIPAKDGAVDVEAVKAKLSAMGVDVEAEEVAEALAKLEDPDFTGKIEVARKAAEPVSEDVEQGGRIDDVQPSNETANPAAGQPIVNVGGKAPAKSEKLSSTGDMSGVLAGAILIAGAAAIGAAVIRRR